MTGRGFDYLGVVVGGMDFTDIAKGAAGLLSGTGGMLSAKGKDDKGKGGDVQAAVERQRLLDEKRHAEESAARSRLVIGIGGGAALTALIVALLRRKPQP